MNYAWALCFCVAVSSSVAGFCFMQWLATKQPAKPVDSDLEKRVSAIESQFKAESLSKAFKRG